MNVVLLDLDQGSRRIEVAALRYGGYDVSTAHTLEQLVTHVRTHRTDAILVDPAQLDIAPLVAELRARTELPIIVVSEGEGDGDLVTALDAGADDYIAKPFVVEVLLARMRAALRRGRASEVPAAIVTEDFTIDIAARRVFRTDGSEISLTGVEFRMVEILLRHPGHIVSREQILEEIWGPRGAHSPHYLRVFVNRIRQKLEPDPAHPRYLHTATGLGLVFKLEHEPEASDDRAP
ncbi:MAG: winged helix-turn-helix domain-containing protein [Acidimicrobiales bacterium]|jgi:two-component system KDP operon response regulator KdpE